MNHFLAIAALFAASLFAVPTQEPVQKAPVPISYDATFCSPGDGTPEDYFAAYVTVDKDLKFTKLVTGPKTILVLDTPEIWSFVKEDTAGRHYTQEDVEIVLKMDVDGFFTGTATAHKKVTAYIAGTPDKDGSTLMKNAFAGFEACKETSSIPQPKEN